MKITKFYQKYDSVIFTLLALIPSGIIGYVKVSYLYSWLYTSDLFSFDTAIQETLKGFLGLEFTYGNVFGDHAYLFIFLLLPLKLLLKSKMVILLVLLGPITYFFSAVVFNHAIKSIFDRKKTFVVSIIYLLGFGFIYRGLIEYFYGFHPDTVSGFLAVTFTMFLIWYESKKTQGEKSSYQFIGFVFFYLLFMSLKEEMALLGLVFFIIAFILKRNWFHFGFIVLSTIITVSGFVFIRLFQTPFNRGNAKLYSQNLELIKEIGFDFFINNPLSGKKEIAIFWLVIFLFIAFFIWGVFLSKKIHPYIAGLFFMGLVKVSAGISVSIFTFFDWHNFPALAMLLCSVLLRLFLPRRNNNIEHKIELCIASFIMLISISSFVTMDLSFAWRNYLRASARQSYIQQYKPELEQIKELVDSERIIAIPPFTALEWVENRYSFYPNGISITPIGIADYIVYPRNIPEKITGGFERSLPIEETLEEFSEIFNTPHFLLLARRNISEDQLPHRERFFTVFGLTFDKTLP